MSYGPRYVNEEWTRFIAHQILRQLRGRYPNASINDVYTVSVLEDDAVVVQVQIDFNSGLPRPSFWDRIKHLWY